MNPWLLYTFDMEKDTLKGIESPYEALGMCAITSFEFAKKHKTFLVRVNDVTTGSKEHWAIYLEKENKVIDLTARQFTTNVSPRFEADLEDWLDEACEWLGDSLVYSIFDKPTNENPLDENWWIRDEINPETFEPENAGLKMLQKITERK